MDRLSARSTSPSSPTRAPPATCTSAASASSRGRRRATTTCSSTSARACTWCRASARSSPTPRSPTGRPFWVDDPAFNLEYHVRHSALPSPGSEEQLRNMAARVFSPAARPHEAALGAVDGPGADPQALRLRHQDPPRARRRRLRRRHRDRALRRQAGSRAGRARPRLGRRARALGRARCWPRTPRGWLRAPDPRCCAGSSRRSSTRGAALAPGSPRRPRRSARSAGTSPTRRPSVPLNVEIGSHRRFEWVRADLAQFKRIKAALGGTVNDVVLAVVTGALRRWLHSRGVRTEGMELRAQVPVSIRAADERGQLGNKIAARARPDPGLRRGPGPAARDLPSRDGGDQAVQAGARRRGDLALQRLRPADPARPGGADQLLDPAVQPRRHQRPRPADPALRARPRARGHLPGRLPAARTRRCSSRS